MPERWRTLAASRWLVPLAVALAGHGLWLAWASLSEGGRRPAPMLRAADDTPELLRFSRQASQPADLAAGLSTVNLPFDQTLPPPPPELDGGRTGPAPTPRASRRSSPSTRAAGGAQGNADPWAITRSSPEGLPDDPATTFALARQLAGGPQQSREATAGTAAAGAAGQATGEPNLNPPPGASGEQGASGAPAAIEPTALAAVARRQTRVAGAAERPWRGLWDRAQVAARPTNLAALPEDVEVRRLDLEAVRRLGLIQPHGISVLSGRSLLLLWVDGKTLWLLKQARSQAGGSALG